MFEVIAAVLLAAILFVLVLAFCGGIYGAGFFAVWYVLHACGALAMAPIWWPCWIIGMVFWLLKPGSVTVNRD